MTATSTEALREWPADGLEPVDCCPVCGEVRRHLLYAGLTDRSYLVAPGRWNLFLCERCSSAYLDPRPNDRTVHLAYGNYYEGGRAKPGRDSVRGWRRLTRALRNGYLNSRYGYALTPHSALGRLVVPLLPSHRDKADEFVRHLPFEPGRARLLDVGCGEGEFLAEMQVLGWSVEGIEPTSEGAAVARARGVTVTEGQFDDVPLPPSSFDAITFRLVFEALHDPVAALEACRRALKPGGLVWIAGPNLDSAAHHLFGRNWIGLEPPRYAVLYRPSSLAGLLRRASFEVVAVRPSRQARWSFRMSRAIDRGLPPFRETPPLPLMLALRAQMTDLWALRRPEVADFTIVVARKS